MVTVEEAERIIQSQTTHVGVEQVPFEQALGRVLAQDLRTDRALPPYDRVTMDGIAFRFNSFARGTRSFQMAGTQAAGDAPLEITQENACVEIMTGAALPASVDTVVRYEDLEIENGVATVLVEQVKKGQNVHRQGQDKQQNEVVALTNQLVTPALVGMAAAVGATELPVKKLPKVLVISTGDELVEVHQTPAPYQIRRSNSYLVKAALQAYQVEPDLLHLPDDLATTKDQLQRCLAQYEVILLSGGISMGKFDYVPQVLEELQVQKLFQKVRQKPGKPFWFGRHGNGALVFALPGNPVSTFLCLNRYFLPWLHASLGLPAKQKVSAALTTDFRFPPDLTYFLQVRLQYSEQGQLLATPLEGNGSGDFSNLVEADAFLELPQERDRFEKGDVLRVWPFKAGW
ncbi:molybdopterin molybdotransferase MoeA [Rufibacter ruber]|uniref:molybdopterin molybdotransferase MoeA n=1 Tax=Rufibacter ruber TaxID=1783499 RepID=UPI00083597B9|nr:molybdopterin molybdotransferase MoeA [Rufibacter ruber]